MTGHAGTEPPPAKVAFWAGSFERAGTQRFLVELVKRIDRDSFRPVILSLKPTGELLAELSRLDVPVLEFGTGPGVFSARTARGFIRAVSYLRRERIDILSCLLGITTLFGPFAGRLAGVPVVVNNQRNLSYWIEGRLEEVVYGYVNRRLVDAVLVNSAAAERELIERFAVPKDRIISIGVGVDADLFARAEVPRDLRTELGLGDGPVVGMVAKLSPVKGHEFFLEAAAEICRSHPGVSFLVVGDGPRRRELEAMADRLGLREAVRFLGARDDVPSLLKLMDVFVLSSLSESSPNAVLEAMAAGVPVVSTRVGGLPELVQDGSTGRLVEPQDAGALADAIVAFLDDPVRARLAGNLARQIAREQFDIERVVRKVEETFAHLLAAAHSRRGWRTRRARRARSDRALGGGEKL